MSNPLDLFHIQTKERNRLCTALCTDTFCLSECPLWNSKKLKTFLEAELFLISEYKCFLDTKLQFLTSQFLIIGFLL